MKVINSQFTEEEALESVIVQDCLPKPRTEARRRMYGENARDDIQLAVWMSSRNLRQLYIILFMILHCKVWKSDLQPPKKLYIGLTLICPLRFEEAYGQQEFL